MIDRFLEGAPLGCTLHSLLACVRMFYSDVVKLEKEGSEGNESFALRGLAWVGVATRILPKVNLYGTPLVFILVMLGV